MHCDIYAGSVLFLVLNLHLLFLAEVPALHDEAAPLHLPVKVVRHAVQLQPYGI